MTDVERWTRVEILRLGHRPERDKRITTHVALVSRAFGASAIHIDTKDEVLEKTINSVIQRFGGDFRIETGVGRKKVIGRWPGTIVHLTMYGAPLDDSVKKIPKNEDVLVIVGAEKVPPDVYDAAHFNISVANQPHSEVSALALFLDRLFEGKELERRLEGGEVEILPTNTGKLVISGDPIKEAMDPFEMDWPVIPSKDECIEIMTLLGVSRSVMKHTSEVHRLGMEFIKRSSIPEEEVDLKLLEAGLLLHDIGRTRTHSIRHITVGESIVKDLGLDERIAGMVLNHGGGGIPADEAVSLGLPSIDMVPRTLEEKIVCHADNLVGEHRRRPLSDVVKRMRSKGAEKAALRIEELHRELEEKLGIDIDELID